MSDEKKKRKKKRSPQELVAAKMRELEKLQARVRRKAVENAIKDGTLSEEKEKEFKELKRKASVLRKAVDILEEEGKDAAAKTASGLSNKFSKAMAAMVDEADEEVEEEEEEEAEDEDEDEYEDEEDEEEEEEEEDED